MVFLGGVGGCRGPVHLIVLSEPANRTRECVAAMHTVLCLCSFFLLFLPHNHSLLSIKVMRTTTRATCLETTQEGGGGAKGKGKGRERKGRCGKERKGPGDGMRFVHGKGREEKADTME